MFRTWTQGPKYNILLGRIQVTCSILRVVPYCIGMYFVRLAWRSIALCFDRCSSTSSFRYRLRPLVSRWTEDTKEHHNILHSDACVLAYVHNSTYMDEAQGSKESLQDFVRIIAMLRQCCALGNCVRNGPKNAVSASSSPPPQDLLPISAMSLRWLFPFPSHLLKLKRICRCI